MKKLIFVKTKRGQERNVRAILSARGFTAKIVPLDKIGFDIMAEIEADSEKEIEQKIADAEKIKGVVEVEKQRTY